MPAGRPGRRVQSRHRRWTSVVVQPVVGVGLQSHGRGAGPVDRTREEDRASNEPTEAIATTIAARNMTAPMTSMTTGALRLLTTGTAMGPTAGIGRGTARGRVRQGSGPCARQRLRTLCRPVCGRDPRSPTRAEPAKCGDRRPVDGTSWSTPHAELGPRSRRPGHLHRRGPRGPRGARQAEEPPTGPIGLGP